MMKKRLFTLLFFLSSAFLTLLSAQNIISVVGNPISGGYLKGGYSGDGGLAAAAELNSPYDIAFDASGNMFIADDGNNVIREVDHTTGNINTVAGNYTYGGGYSGDGGLATAAELLGPASVAFDDSGNMAIADYGNNIIRKIDHITGNISTMAGNYSYGGGYSGNSGPATAAELDGPTSIAFDTSGNLFIAEYGNNVIRKVDNGTGIISTFAGIHVGGYSGDGGPAIAAKLSSPVNIAFDHSGNLYISDYRNNVIREVNHSTGNITTVAGDTAHEQGYSGDGGTATAAGLNFPWGIAVNDSGSLFIADQFNNVIRGVSHSNGNIYTVAGNYNGGISGYSGDGGPATAAELKSPTGIAIDPAGNLFIADNGNNVIREITSVIKTGIEKVTSLSSNEVSVYPNPNNGNFEVFCHSVLPEAGEESLPIIQVYNLLGEKVFTETLRPAIGGTQGDNTININSQPDGVYFMQIITSDGNITKRIVIER